MPIPEIRIRALSLAPVWLATGVAIGYDARTNRKHAQKRPRMVKDLPGRRRRNSLGNAQAKGLCSLIGSGERPE